MDIDGEDLYALLGLQNSGRQVPLRDVRKAYKARALVLHPDKQAGKNSTEIAAAAVEFEKVQRAIEILGDEKARKDYDDSRQLHKGRLEKEAQFSCKRRRTQVPENTRGCKSRKEKEAHVQFSFRRRRRRAQAPQRPCRWTEAADFGEDKPGWMEAADLDEDKPGWTPGWTGAEGTDLDEEKPGCNEGADLDLFVDVLMAAYPNVYRSSYNLWSVEDYSRKMRQRGERERIIKEMQEADAKEADAKDP